MKEGKQGLRLICTAFILAILLCGNVFAVSGTGLIYGENGTITRAEWLHDLVVLFDMTVEEDNYPDNYFHDVTSDSKYYVDILKTVEFGVVDIPAGGDVEPDKSATREFVAHTLNYCLGYELGDNPEYTMSDADNLTYQQDAQVAVNRKWFALINGEFSADTPVTSDEVEVMEADVRTVLSDGVIDENHENVFEYADGVIVVPENTPVSFEDNGTIIIDDPNVGIGAEDTFVVLLDGLPQPYIADSVEVLDGKCVISAKEIGTEDVVLSADAQGKLDANWYSVIPAAGTTVTYIEGGTAAASYADGIEHIGFLPEDNIPIEAVKLEHTMEIGGVNVQVGGILSNLFLEYKVEGNDHHARVALKGSAEVTGSVNADLLKMGGVPKEIPLATIKYGPDGLLCGTLNVSIVIAVDGRLSVVYSASYFEVGLEYRDSTGIRVLKTFIKKEFDLETSISATLGFRAQATLSIPCVTGTVYGEMGAKAQYKSKTYDDGKKPLNCSTLHGWLYMETGSSLVISYTNLLTFKKEQKKLSKKQIVYDLNNSPVRLIYHWEDGVLVRSCARDKSKYWYTTGFNSRYGSLGDGYGYDETGNYVPVFTYSLAENEYHEQEATITGYTGSAYALSIPEEIDGYKVVAIGWSAFKGRSDLRAVSIPNTVTKIEAYAFQDCINLSQVNLSKNLTEMKGRVFDNCISLTSVWVPKSLVSADETFSQCKALEHVSFEEGTKQIASGLFEGCTGLKQIAIPETVTTISASAFKDCVNLQEIEIPEAVTEIGWSAFCGCIRMTSVQMGDGVTEIAPYAFQDCTKLSELKLSKNLAEMKGRVFYNCISLASVWIPKSLVSADETFSQCKALEHVSFEKGTKQIASGLFEGCTGLKQITIPKTVTMISASAFKDCVNLQEIEIPEAVTEIGWSAFCGCICMTSVQMGDGVTEIAPYAFQDCTKLSELKLSKNLIEMKGRVFYNCISLTSVWIPKSLVSADETFSQCKALEHVSFEEGTKQIASGLFEGCTGLKQITIPETVTTISASAFKDCVNLQEVEIPKTVTEIGWSAFKGCICMTSVQMGDGVTEIAPYAFQDCTKLSELKLSKNLIEMEGDAFAGCISLTEVEIPDTLTTISAGAFRESGLVSLKLPDSINWIKDSAFQGCEQLRSVILPDSVAAIGNDAFRDCPALLDVTLGNGLKTIGEAVFRNCDALATITIPDSVTSIGEYCFAESDVLTDVKLGTGITVIPSYTFDHCLALKSIVLPYRVARIELNAFTNCTQLAEISIPQSTVEIADMDSDSSKVFSYPSKMTIYGVAGTYAETYAKAKDIIFEAINHPAEKVSLDQTELKMLNGTSQRLVLSVEPTNFTDAVSWKSTDASIVSVDESGSGEITAKAVGTATIKVSAGTKNTTCEVTVVQPVTSVSLNRSSLSLQALETFQLDASVYPDNAENKEIEWSSSDEEIASVDENGFVTAHKKGKATITVKALDGSEKKAACEVTVTNTAHEAESVEALESSHPYEMNCTDYWIYTDPNASESIKVAFDTRTSTEKNFDYIYIYDGEGNEIGKFTGDDLSGKVITVPGDTVKIQLETDESADDESVEWGFRVTSITSGSERLPQEFTGTIAYSKTYGDPAFALDCVLTAGDGELSYESDNEAVASVDADGNVTINGAGTAQITVTASATADYQRTQQTITIEVAKAKQELKLDYSTDTLYVGETLVLHVISENGTPSFTSDQEAVAAVSADGVVTGVAPGTAKITAALAGDRNHEEAQETVGLTVLEIPDGSVSLTKCRVTLDPSSFVYDGKEKKPKAAVSYNGTKLAEDVDYTLSYRNNIQPGTAYVVVKAVDGSGYYGVAEKEFTIRPKLPEDAKTIEPYAFSDCDDLYEANIGENVTEIGDGAFAGCDNLKDVYFSGNAPKMGEGVFEGVTATAYYPADDSSWTRDVLASYGGNITWKAWDPETGKETKRSITICTAKLEATEYVYDGEPKTPAVTVMDGKVLLEEDTDYTVNYSDNTEPGAATVTVQGIGEYGGTIILNFTIRKLAPTLRFAADTVSRTYGDAPFKNPLDEIETDGTVTYSSGNGNVATVDGSGTVTIRGAGTTRITALASAGESYETGSASYTLTVSKAANTITAGDIAKTWSKKQQSFAIGAIAGGGAKLGYSSNNSSLPVSAAGVVTAPKKYIGSAVVTIRSAETANYKAAAKTITVSVNPKGTSLRKVTNNGAGSAAVTWKKNANVKGYQIQYSTDKQFASGVKTKNVSGKKKVKLTLKKLKKGKTYYVRIRTWTKVKGKKYYSAWSKAKRVKIKK